MRFRFPEDEPRQQMPPGGKNSSNESASEGRLIKCVRREIRRDVRGKGRKEGLSKFDVAVLVDWCNRRLLDKRVRRVIGFLGGVSLNPDDKIPA
jgi:hypothetical protein